MKKQWALRLVVSGIISGVILYSLFKTISPDITHETQKIGVLIRSIPIEGLLVFLLLTLGQSVFRTLRYQLLIRIAEKKAPPHFLRIGLITLSRNMFVDLFPARVGEVSYLAMLNRGLQISAAACVSSFSISFLFDFIALWIIFVAILVFQTFFQIELWVLYFVIVLGILTLLGLGLFIKGPALLKNIIQKRPVSEAKPLIKIFQFLSQLGLALHQSQNSGCFLRVTCLSLLLRLCKYGSLYAAFVSIARIPFPELSQAPIWELFLMFVASEGASSLPIPSFMSFGLYEAGGTALLSTLGYPAGQTASVLLAVHVISQVVDYTLGWISFLIFQWGIKRQVIGS